VPPGSGPKLVHDGQKLARLSRDCSTLTRCCSPLPLKRPIGPAVVKASPAIESAGRGQGLQAGRVFVDPAAESATAITAKVRAARGRGGADLSGLNRNAGHSRPKLWVSSTAEAGLPAGRPRPSLSVFRRSLAAGPQHLAQRPTVAWVPSLRSGGIGSLRWGFLRDPGNLIGS